MTLAKFLKEYDLTVDHLCSLTGRSRQTLYHWYNYDKEFFFVLLYGVMNIKETVVFFDDDDIPF